MKTVTNPEISGICSVTAMAGQVGLSRARFYELMAEGVFPQPLYSLRKKRPFYTRTSRENARRFAGQGLVWAANRLCSVPPVDRRNLLGRPMWTMMSSRGRSVGWTVR
jgi:hypothetical protein